MIGQLELLETVTLTNKVEVNFACTSSDDDKILMLNSEGAYIFHLRLTKENNFPILSFKKFFITCSSYDFSTNMNIDTEKFWQYLTPEELSECMLRPELNWDDFKKYHPMGRMEKKLIAAKFSPSDINPSVGPLVAALNNTGALVLYMNQTDQHFVENYIEIENITDRYVGQMKTYWSELRESEKASAKFMELKKRVEQIRPTGK